MAKKFSFAISELQFKNETKKINALILLKYRDLNSLIHVGDEWQFNVRLKRIHSTVNPGSFDYEASAMQKGIRASGYIILGKENYLLRAQKYNHLIDKYREYLYKKILTLSPHNFHSPWLMALILGERVNIPQQDWQVLKNTGTNHLMAIAGLHIGLVSGFIYKFSSWCWRKNAYLTLRLPASIAGRYFSLLAALIYSALAGFSIPTQRACIMLFIFVCGLLTYRRLNTWHVWALALSIVLLMNPLDLLSESIWLSFGTIALIIYGMSGRLAPHSIWWQWGRAQWVIGIGLIPLTLFFFQQCSLVSFMANTIAIPWLGFLILPFCLFAVILLPLSSKLSYLFLWLADKDLSGLWIILTWFSQLHFSIWQKNIAHMSMLLSSLIGVLLLLLPAGFPGKYFGLIWMLPLLVYHPPSPSLGDVWLTMLDVGQGLSVIVQTKHHLLIYDTGAKLSHSFDMGENVVLPYLYTLNSHSIDMMVISHGDNDHAGGAKAILNALPVSTITTSAPEKLRGVPTQFCLQGRSWRWDEVEFSFIYPTKEMLNLGNDSSCVLRIDNGNQRILIAGDIEMAAENYLVTHSAQTLAANILIAPHHGSKTSALPSFIAAVHPQYVLYGVGYRNRYHFPHPSVIASYELAGVHQLDTVHSGAIYFKLTRDKKTLSPEMYRLQDKDFWHDG